MSHNILNFKGTICTNCQHVKEFFGCPPTRLVLMFALNMKAAWPSQMEQVSWNKPGSSLYFRYWYKWPSLWTFVVSWVQTTIPSDFQWRYGTGTAPHAMTSWELSPLVYRRSSRTLQIVGTNYSARRRENSTAYHAQTRSHQMSLNYATNLRCVYSLFIDGNRVCCVSFSDGIKGCENFFIHGQWFKIAGTTSMF